MAQSRTENKTIVTTRETDETSAHLSDSNCEVPAIPAENDDLSFLARPQLPDEIGRLVGYRILKQLGKGGMGMVLLAVDERLDRKVALKVMLPKLAANPSHKARFLREAKAAAAIESDYIIPIYHVGEDRGVPFLAMKFLQGEPLDVLLKRSKKLPVERVRTFGRQIALGLAAAHEKGLVHRDIKPGNIFLEDTGDGRRVRILDFGLARPVEEDMQLTGTGLIVGTPAYMSPEQARGEGVGPASDLFSLGVILYQMVTGTRPFKGDSAMAVLTSLAIDTPTAPTLIEPLIPLGISDLISKLLAKDPAQRPASARAVAQALEGTVSNPSIVIVEPLPSPELQPLSEPVPAPQSDFCFDESSMAITPVKSAVLAKPQVQRPVRRDDSNILWYVAGLLFLLVGLFCFHEFAWKTSYGNLVLFVKDPDVEAKIGNGSVQILDKEGKLKYTLKPSEKNAKLPVGEYLLEVSGADGVMFDTKEFKIVRGKETPVRAFLDSKVNKTADVLPAAVERKAAEYVLSFGGTVRINGLDKDIKSAYDLPRDAFQLTGVDVSASMSINDAGLSCLKDCKNLISIGLKNPNVGDAGLAYFKDCKYLTSLNLTGTKATDAGMVYFKDCKKLTSLTLQSTKVGDAGLVHFKDCKNLTLLDLSNSQVGDLGLSNFKDCKRLSNLGLNNTRVTDEGLAYFENCKFLTHLSLNNTPVTDDGIAYFKDCKNLTSLLLRETKVTDMGLANFKDFKKLLSLDLSHDLVADAGITCFKDCKNLTTLTLQDTQVTDAGLANFKDFKLLTNLDLSHIKMSDEGLANFKDCKSLTSLEVGSTSVGDASLAFFKDFKALRVVGLAGTQVTDAGLASLKDCKKLQILTLQKTKVTAAKIEELKKALPACRIEWDVVAVEPKK